MAENIVFTTTDGVAIAGEYLAGQVGGPAALLLHMMPAIKESWRPFAAELQAAGFSVLAIDLRGHGESTSAITGKIDYKNFEDADHQAKIHDVEAATAWLAAHGANPKRTALAGASIGANLAIQYAAEHHEIPAVVALSPGLDYRGVTTADKVARFSASQALLLVASSEDEYSFLTNKKLAEIKTGAALIELNGAGHGTTMFENQPQLMDEAVGWLTERSK